MIRTPLLPKASSIGLCGTSIRPPRRSWRTVFLRAPFRGKPILALPVMAVLVLLPENTGIFSGFTPWIRSWIWKRARPEKKLTRPWKDPLLTARNSLGFIVGINNYFQTPNKHRLFFWFFPEQHFSYKDISGDFSIVFDLPKEPSFGFLNFLQKTTVPCQET